MTNLTDQRTLLTGLLFECPLGGNPTDCQLCAIRQRPVSERLQYLRDLSDAEAERTYESHVCCLRQKTGDH